MNVSQITTHDRLVEIIESIDLIINWSSTIIKDDLPPLRVVIKLMLNKA